MNQQSFFGTTTDLSSLVRAIESEQLLRYVLTGLFDVPDAISIQSLLDVPDLGRVEFGNTNQSSGYLVASRELNVELRPVPQRRGGVKYAVDQTANPNTIVFRPGGAFGESCLIAGQVGFTSNAPRALELFHLFMGSIQRQFTKVKSFYVGKEAGQLLDNGWRLTTNAKSPVLYDLKR